MNIEPQHEMASQVNAVPSGWTKMYTRDNLVRLVPDSEVDEALRDGLMTQPFDMDGALAEFNAAIEDARTSVPKALAESIATGFHRDEDSWIINDCMTKVRDSFAKLIFTAGALLPTEADIHALREYLDDEPHRAELRAQVEAMHAADQEVPDGLEKNANGSEMYAAKAARYADALAKLPADKHAIRVAHAEADRVTREATAADTLAKRVRSLQLSYKERNEPCPYELENGVFKRAGTDGKLHPADPNTGDFLKDAQGNILA